MKSSYTNLTVDKKEELVKLLDHYMKNHVYDFFTSILVMKLTFRMLEEIIEVDIKMDNTLIHFNDDLKKYVNT